MKAYKQFAVEYSVLKGDVFSSATIIELSSSALHKPWVGFDFLPFNYSELDIKQILQIINEM